MGHKGGLWQIHKECSGIAKGTFWTEATSNSEKIKPVALELHESEGREHISKYFVHQIYLVLVISVLAC